MIWNRATTGVLSKVPLNAQWAQKSFVCDVVVCVFMNVCVGPGASCRAALVSYSIQSPWDSAAGKGR